MGGMGSGRQPFSGRSTCESALSIDVLYWNRKELLDPGRRFNWVWSFAHQATWEISVSIEWHDAAFLSYALRGQSACQWVPIKWTECNFGGQRPWFKCPNSPNGID